MKKVAASPPAAPAWSAENGYVRMMIRDLVTEVRLGLHPWERHPEKPQRIVINPMNECASAAANRAVANAHVIEIGVNFEAHFAAVTTTAVRLSHGV